MRLVPVLALLSLIAASWSAETKVNEPKATDPNANGTDPTLPINRLQGTVGFDDLPHGGSAATVTARADYVIPSHPDLALRAEVPLLWLDNGHDSETGLGDLYAEVLKTLPVPDQRVTAAAALGIVLPTANEDALGAGKWQLAPKLVGALHLDKEDKSLAYVEAQDFFSVSGDENRDSVHYLLITAAFRQNLDKGLWLLGGLNDRYDWKTDNLWSVDDFHNNLQAKLEGGLVFAPAKAAWVDLYFPLGDNRYLEFGISASVMMRY